MLAGARRLRRRANRLFYRFLFRLYRRAFPTPRWTGPVDPRSVRRVLVVRDDRVGDMVVTTPLLSFLRDILPHADVDVLASPANAPIARGHPGVTNVFVNDRSWPGWIRVVRRVRARRYDLILSPVTRKAMREGFTAAMLARRSTYKVSSWRSIRYQGLFTAVARVPPRLTHMSERTLYVGQYAFGVRPTPGDAARYPMRLERDADAEQRVAAFLAANGIDRFAAVNISAGGRDRDWRAERCAAFLDLLLARHPELDVVLTRPRGSEARVADVMDRVRRRRLVAAPPGPVADFIALVRRALVVVTPETALIHVASACGRPVIVLFGPQHPNDVPLWLPVGVPSRVLVSRLGGNLNDIDPASVADAFDELWSEIGAGRMPASARS